MPDTTDGRIALVALVALTGWVLVGLPLIYLPTSASGVWGWLSKDASGFFTFFLLIVAAAQLALFWYQLRLIRVSLDEAKTTAMAAADAAKASSRQADAAEQSLAKIERPYLFVFSVSALSVDEIEDSEDGYTQLRITYSVANHGKIPAIIKHAQAGLSVCIDPISPLRLDHTHPLIVSPVLAPGEQRTGIEDTLPWEGELYSDEWGSRWPHLEHEELWFWAIITYRGPFTDQHETRICWRYDSATHRFTGPFGGPEFSGEK
jgi:flagellar basal body-associated protein FliL